MSKEMREILDNERAEGRAEGRKEGRKEGRAEGRAEGMLNVLVGMVKDKLLSMAEAAKRFGVSEKEFAKLAKA